MHRPPSKPTDNFSYALAVTHPIEKFLAEKLSAIRSEGNCDWDLLLPTTNDKVEIKVDRTTYHWNCLVFEIESRGKSGGPFKAANAGCSYFIVVDPNWGELFLFDCPALCTFLNSEPTGSRLVQHRPQTGSNGAVWHNVSISVPLRTIYRECRALITTCPFFTDEFADVEWAGFLRRKLGV